MSELEKLGVTAQRRFLLHSGEETSADKAERTELAFTLPKSAEVQVSFSSESLGTMLRKVFKKEIQTGDPLFDEAVNIRTDTVDATTALLESTDLRASIESLVINHGTLELVGASVKIELPGQQPVDAELALNVVRSLLE
jgi:hypothetical protein